MDNLWYAYFYGSEKTASLLNDNKSTDKEKLNKAIAALEKINFLLFEYLLTEEDDLK